MKYFLSVSIVILFMLACRTDNQSTEKNIPGPDTAQTQAATPVIPDTVPPVIREIPPDYDTMSWTDMARLDTTIQVDMKYAGVDNFVEEKMYPCSRCFLRPEVALAVWKAHEILTAKGYGLKMLDCYRPRPIQQKLWDKVPNPSYVTPPGKGSMHNRGSAVDLTLVDADGNELDMGTPFDFFGKKAHQDYTDLPLEILERRKLLRETMKSVALYPIRTEWWHYYYAPNAPKGHPLADWVWACDSLRHNR